MANTFRHDKLTTMDKFLAVNRIEDIPSQYRDTPIGRLLEYNNLGRPHESYTQAQILIGMCMDNRKHLHTPDNFAYILRSGGANFRHSEFKISYAIAVGGVRYVALIGHTQCGMVSLHERKDLFVKGMVENAGWDALAAATHFEEMTKIFEIHNESDFILSEVKRLRFRYPKVQFAPLIYRVEDNRLYLLKELA